jgi:hypothetical protein
MHQTTHKIFSQHITQSSAEVLIDLCNTPTRAKKRNRRGREAKEWDRKEVEKISCQKSKNR